ncbi:MAG TPA: DUF1559 domain-containing protein, partial [Lacipirellulaceae bacterium]|nr:DUF1559 domain-containing protein [Lacipirellulaceae bacterium]
SFVCPSDINFEPIIDVYNLGFDTRLCQMAAASYVGSAGTVRPTCKVCRDAFDGVFGRNRAIKPADITDGLSNTIAVGERSNYWASAAIWGVVPRSVVLDRQQRGRYAAGPAYVLGTTFVEGFNIESSYMDHSTMNTFAESFLSMHPGGAFFVFCDGAVRFTKARSNGPPAAALVTASADVPPCRIHTRPVHATRSACGDRRIADRRCGARRVVQRGYLWRPVERSRVPVADPPFSRIQQHHGHDGRRRH